MLELVDAVDLYFEVILADTPQLREQVFRLRYQVYCVETKLEDASQYRNEMESDQFDQRSLHVLLRHRATGWWAGTTRIVLPDKNDFTAPFPLELVSPDVLAPTVGSVNLPRASSAEISRFAVSKEFRRRHAEYLSPSGTPQMDDPQPGSSANNQQSAPLASGAHPTIERRMGDQERQVVPHIALGLMQGIVWMSCTQITHWCAAMEPTLLRLLSRLGIRFNKIGPLIEYHGKRQPCLASVNELLALVKAEHRDVWEVLVKHCPSQRTRNDGPERAIGSDGIS